MIGAVTRHWVLKAAASCLGMALLGGCAGGNAPQVGQTSALQGQGDAAATPNKELVKVALILPVSAAGHPGLIGKSLKQAAELALFERDNPTLQLIVKDDRGTPEGAKAAAEEAVKGGAALILGPLFAKSVVAVAPVARQAGIPVITFSNDRQVAGNGVYLLSFQPGPDVERVMNYAVSQGKRRFVALVPEDQFGKITEAAFKEAAGRLQITVVAIERYPASANGMLEPLRRIGEAIKTAEAEGAPVDALFLPGGQDNIEMVGRLLPQADIDTQKVKLIGTGGMDYPNAGRDARLVGAWYPGPDPRGWSDFAQKYAKSYNQSPPRIASLAYDAVSMAIALSSGEGRFTAASVTRASGFNGVDGAFRLLPDGTTERSLAIHEVQKFGTGVLDPAASPRSQQGPAASGIGTSLMKSLFNFN
jgi:ABC-type branched-subunit amino acid transport system substrate-binding protein